jgi:uncharacterized iron-regulated membrane protein
VSSVEEISVRRIEDEKFVTDPSFKSAKSSCFLFVFEDTDPISAGLERSRKRILEATERRSVSWVSPLRVLLLSVETSVSETGSEVKVRFLSRSTSPLLESTSSEDVITVLTFSVSVV